MLPRPCHIICIYYLNTDMSLRKKTLTESLVFSHSLYCLPVWDPSLSHYSLQRLQRMHNRAVYLCKSLYKYDHVSHHYQSLNWLPFELLVQHRSLCPMNKLFKFQCIPLDPPIVFGRIHSHQTRTRVFFAQPVRCRFSFTQRYFRSRATLWWNALSEDKVMARDFSNNLFLYLLSNYN